ncbi:uncharacterized protein DDB_G0283697-like [Ostrea edulis]|uniref:uncharacterized protein DDB_G0283697-like n=1 Tax=Ostrea edulis TaxID=37623 RepID=UPI0024AF260D|nr:uncharacterized protein DDB_G0283697-like [Ostrea edulis]
MEEFVRKLVKKSDLSFLTKGRIKEAYRNKVGREITSDEKNSLNEVLKTILIDINQHGGNKENAPSLASPLKTVNSTGRSTFVKQKGTPKHKLTKKFRTSLSPRLRVDEVVDAVMKSSDEEEEEEEEYTPQKKKSPVKKLSPIKKTETNIKKRSINKIQDVVSAVLNSESEEDGKSECDSGGDDTSEDENDSVNEPDKQTDSESEIEPFKDESKLMSQKKDVNKMCRVKNSVEKMGKRQRRKRYSLSSSESNNEDEDIADNSSEESDYEKEHLRIKKTTKRKKMISSDSEQSEEDVVPIPKRKRRFPSERKTTIMIVDKDSDSEVEDNSDDIKYTTARNEKSPISKTTKNNTTDKRDLSTSEGSSSEDEGLSLAEIRKLSSSSQSSGKGDRTLSSSSCKSLSSSSCKSSKIKDRQDKLKTGAKTMKKAGQNKKETDSAIKTKVKNKSKEKKRVRRGRGVTSDDEQDDGQWTDSDSECEVSHSVLRKKSVSKTIETTEEEQSSSSDDDLSTRTTQKKDPENSDSSIDSDSEASLEIPLPVQTKKKASKVAMKKSQGRKSSGSGDGEEEGVHVKELKKICRAVGIIVTNTRHLAGCSTDNQKVSRLKQLLREAGMEGRPSMKKVEDVKLMKEAAELDRHNILRTEGRGKRRVNSLFSRSDNSPKVKATPPREKFSRLRDIIDSDISD